MFSLQVRLLGELSLRHGDRQVDSFESVKAQELFCYLLLHRQRPHRRETLAGLLWCEASTAQAKSYLRKALWQLQQVFDQLAPPPDVPILVMEGDALQVNSSADLWLDVSALENAYYAAEGVPGRLLGTTQAQTLRAAADLYQGELLPGWYQEWCLYERERLYQMWLSILEKLMAFSEAQRQYEVGIMYGARLLCSDPAHEPTYRQLMRLYYLMGDRSSALRQYERSVAALRAELGVAPARSTEALYRQIQADQPLAPAAASEDAMHTRDEDALDPITARLDQLQSMIGEVIRMLHDLHNSPSRIDRQG